MSEVSHVVRVQRSKTSQGKPMWTCSVKGGGKVNIFDSQRNSLINAGYPEIVEMELDEVMRWNIHPIEIETVQKGKWLNLSTVIKRKPDAVPDPTVVFESNASQASVLIQLNAIMNLPDEEVVVFDCETTGVDGMDEILSIAIITLNSGKNMLPEENIFICPTDPALANKAVDVHGITPEFIEGKPSFPEVYDIIREALHGKVWVAYNTDFDWEMLDLMCSRYGLDPIVPAYTIDAMQLYGRFSVDWTEEVVRWKCWKLVEATEAMGIEVKDAHNAYGDILMTRLMLHQILASSS